MIHLLVVSSARLDLICLAISSSSLRTLEALAHAGALLISSLIIGLTRGHRGRVGCVAVRRRSDILLLVFLLYLSCLSVLLALGSALIQDIRRILRQDANGVISLLYNRHLRQDLGFELPLLFLVGPLLDISNFEPRIIEQIFRRRPSVIVDIQASLENVEVLAGHPLVVDVVSSSLDAAVQIVVCLPSEWEAPVEQRVEENASGPDVSRRSCILDLRHDLRRHVGWCTAEHANLLVVGDARRESEVDELDVLGLIKQDVLQFDVPVSDALAMAVFECDENLLEDPSRLLLVQLLVDHLFEV